MEMYQWKHLEKQLRAREKETPNKHGLKFKGNSSASRDIKIQLREPQKTKKKHKQTLHSERESTLMGVEALEHRQMERSLCVCERE